MVQSIVITFAAAALRPEASGSTLSLDQYPECLNTILQHTAASQPRSRLLQ